VRVGVVVVAPFSVAVHSDQIARGAGRWEVVKCAVKVRLGISALVVVLCFATAASSQSIGPLSGLADLSDASSHRSSSADPTGGNADRIKIPAGSSATLADIKGPGSISHIWFTINSPSPYHLRELVMRMFWDGESQPSVEVPLGDFFGTGFEFEDIPGGHRGQAYHSWVSLPLTVQDRALNCYFEMPFASGVRITVTNDRKDAVPNLYFHVDCEQFADRTKVDHKGRLHAQWRHQVTRAVPESETAGKNLNGKDNYVFLEAQGKGQDVGTILNVFGLSTGWWGEGDDMFFIDGDGPRPTISGTGMEDYFNNAWMFQREFNYPFIGYSQAGNRDWTGSHTMYRFHIQDPIYFQKSLRAGIEHGHANDRSDEYTSVAFWYQAEPHLPFPPLAPIAERIPISFWRVLKLPANLPN
jgi:hypothetical protein